MSRNFLFIMKKNPNKKIMEMIKIIKENSIKILFNLISSLKKIWSCSLFFGLSTIKMLSNLTFDNVGSYVSKAKQNVEFLLKKLGRVSI